MGNRNSGRRPQSTALRILRGDPSKGKTPINLNEPKPEAPDASFDAPPPELADNARASAEWARVVPIMRRCGLVSAIERPLLIAVCRQWAIYLEAHEHVSAEGLVTAKRGGGGPNPYLSVADRALAHCERLWSELGASPSSRSKVVAIPTAPTITGEAPSNPWAGILS